MQGARVLVIDDSPTIVRVVKLALTKAGMDVMTAADGEEGIAMAQAMRPDLILLDFVMPRMNGYQVCRALAEIPELNDVPVLLMSAKADQVGERFVQVVGVVGYVTKPFSPETLLASVSRVLAERAARREIEPEQAVEEVSERERRSLAEARQQRLLRLGEALLATLAERGERTLADGLRPQLDTALLERLLEATALPLGAGHKQADLMGGLTSAWLGTILGVLQVERQTGLLLVQRGQATVRVSFREGRIDFVAGEGLGEEHLLGRYLHELGVISREELERYLAARLSGGEDTRTSSEQLLRLEHIDPGDLREALRRQSVGRLREALGWRAGCYAFTPTATLDPLADKCQLSLVVDAVLLEHARYSEDELLVRRALDDLETVFLQDDNGHGLVSGGRLTRDELMVLDLVDGRNAVRDIQRECPLDPAEVVRVLGRLYAGRVIRRRVLPVML